MKILIILIATVVLFAIEVGLILLLGNGLADLGMSVKQAVALAIYSTLITNGISAKTAKSVLD